jgi:ABC-type dipeptide/oligopeptide/nickel transport system permease subunit
VLVLKYTAGCAVISSDLLFVLITTDTAGPVPARVYVAVATALLVAPVATAIALMVSVALTEIAAVYLVELVVGVVPFVV